MHQIESDGGVSADSLMSHQTSPLTLYVRADPSNHQEKRGQRSAVASDNDSLRAARAPAQRCVTQTEEIRENVRHRRRQPGGYNLSSHVMQSPIASAQLG